MPSSDQRPYHAQPRFARVTPLSRPTPETTQRRDSGPGTPERRLVATGPTALPTHRGLISVTVPITVGGVNRVIPSFRARVSRPAAQESPRRPADVRGRVETISDHVFFVSLILGICGRYAVTSFERNDPYLRHFDKSFLSKMKSLVASIQGADGGDAQLLKATVADLNGLCTAAAGVLGSPVTQLQYFHDAIGMWRDLEWDSFANNAELRPCPG